jgi:RNA polymerase sigma-70 factor (ECF subfamily)
MGVALGVQTLRVALSDRAEVSDRLSAADAFDALGGAVLGYLRAGGSHDPEDLLGDVFLAVAAGIDRFEGDADALRRWVFTIAHHRLVDERRRVRRRSLWRDEQREQTVVAGDPFDPALLAALNDLTPQQREVLVLRFVADLSLEAVAAITHRRVGAIKAMQLRGLRALSERLGVDRSASGE